MLDSDPKKIFQYFSYQTQVLFHVVGLTEVGEKHHRKGSLLYIEEWVHIANCLESLELRI